MEAGPEPRDKIQALMAQTDGVIDQMKTNMEQVLKREEKAYDLLEKSKEMELEVGLTAGVWPFFLP